MNRRVIISFPLTVFLLTVVTRSLFAPGSNHIDSGATAWMLTSTALVLLMVQGSAMFQGKLAIITSALIVGHSGWMCIM